jgi:hypothetical protein
VHKVPNFPEYSRDSAITARLTGKDSVTVQFMFDNPCGFAVTARARQVADTLDVHFILARGGKLKNEPLPMVYGCPATILTQAFRVTVDRSRYKTRVVRGFSGNETDMELIAAKTILEP